MRTAAARAPPISGKPEGGISPSRVSEKTDESVLPVQTLPSEPDGLSREYHARGNQGLISRGLKDSGSEEMPLRRFPPDAVLCYMMPAAFFLYGTFKEDVLPPVIPLQTRAVRVRRLFIDIAVKAVFHSGRITAKCSSAVFGRLNLKKYGKPAACLPAAHYKKKKIQKTAVPEPAELTGDGEVCPYPEIFSG